MFNSPSLFFFLIHVSNNITPFSEAWISPTSSNRNLGDSGRKGRVRIWKRALKPLKPSSQVQFCSVPRSSLQNEAFQTQKIDLWNWIYGSSRDTGLKLTWFPAAGRRTSPKTRRSPRSCPPSPTASWGYIHWDKLHELTGQLLETNPHENETSAEDLWGETRNKAKETTCVDPVKKSSHHYHLKWLGGPAQKHQNSSNHSHKVVQKKTLLSAKQRNTELLTLYVMNKHLCDF